MNFTELLEKINKAIEDINDLEQKAYDKLESVKSDKTLRREEAGNIILACNRVVIYCWNVKKAFEDLENAIIESDEKYLERPLHWGHMEENDFYVLDLLGIDSVLTGNTPDKMALVYMIENNWELSSYYISNFNDYYFKIKKK